MTASPLFSISLRVFTPLAIPNGWAWTPWAGPDPAAVESLEDLTELPRLLRSYGGATAQVLRFKDADHFQVTAFGARSGSVYGRDEWLWDAHCHAYRPHGEPWVPRMTRARLLTVQAAPTGLLPIAPPRPAAPFHVVA